MCRTAIAVRVYCRIASSTRSRRRLLQSFALIACGIVLAEGLLRLLQPLPNGYFLLYPNQHEEVHLPSAMMVGVPAVARHATNAQGVRADPLDDSRIDRILAIGGSTTASGALDAPQTWPSRLQALLTAAAPRLRPWVGNAGKDGLSSRHHLVTMDRFVPRHPRIDAVIVLAGVNDLLKRLGEDEAYRALSTDEVERDPETYRRTFAVLPAGAPWEPWFARFAIGRLVRRLGSEARRPPARTPSDALAGARARRRDARVVRATLPDLDPALREYARNMDAIVDRGAAMGLRVILLTQPVLWKAEMTADETATLMFGFVGQDPRKAEIYYSAAALAAGMAKFNDVTRDVCRRRGVECVDLAADLSSDLTVFYDDCHFNIHGAEQVADRIAAAIVNRPPFR